MSTTAPDQSADRIAYPVDSATRPCCKGIGAHTPDRQPDVPAPAGAVRLLPWESPAVSGHPEWLRYFDGTTRTVALDNRDRDAEVTIEGAQWGDGRVDGWAVRVFNVNSDWPLTLEQARALGEALIAAADEISGSAR